MRHIGTIASRELKSLFLSPVAYVVLTLWSVIAGTFFLASLLGFNERLMRAQQFQAFQAIEEMNLNDHLIEPFIGSMWVILLFLLPAITMGLVASEKANGTDELLLTSPLTIWENKLRVLAGEGIVYQGSFIQYWVHTIMFFNMPQNMFTIVYAAFFIVVCLTFIVIRPRRRCDG